MKLTAQALFVPLVLLCCGCPASTPPTPPEPAPPPAEPPAAAQVDVEIMDTAALAQLVQSHQGKVVVMDVWSTSCEPCLKEFPGLVELHEAFGPERLACISVSVDYYGVGTPEDFRDDVLAFLERQHATFDNVLLSEPSEVAYQKLEMAAPPAVYVYDRRGDLLYRFENNEAGKPPFTYATDIRPLVARLLETPATGG